MTWMTPVMSMKTSAVSTHEEPDSDDIPTKLNDFFSDIDKLKEKLKIYYRGDKAIQRAVATLH